MSCPSTLTTTRYRWLGNAELLGLIESRLGQSPLLDELAARLEALDSDYDEDAFQEDAFQASVASLLESLGAQVSPLDPDPRVIPDQVQLAVPCKVCEATTHVLVDSYLLPE